jgi:hypothetical protein
MASYIGRAFVGFFVMLFRYSRWLPAGFSGLFVVITFLSDLFTKGISFATIHIAQILFAAEYIINQNVHLAIQNSDMYTLNSFFAILSSVIILFMFIKFLTKLFVKIAGAQAEYGAIFMSIVFVAMLESIVIWGSTGKFGFIPFYHGLWFLLTNLVAVVTNIHFF